MSQSIDCLTAICTFIDEQKHKVSQAKKAKQKQDEKKEHLEESKEAKAGDQQNERPVEMVEPVEQIGIGNADVEMASEGSQS